MIDYLLSQGSRVISVDIHKHIRPKDCELVTIQLDLRNKEQLDSVFMSTRPTQIIHCAAKLAHETKDKGDLWSSNVQGTRNICELAKKYAVKNLVFLSSNCLWGTDFGRPVLETDHCQPVEIYGESKQEGERILLEYKESFHWAIIRCPTIVDEGRLGLLGILFEFIDDNKTIWVVGGGKNRYQFIYAKDLAHACFLASDIRSNQIFNIGSDDVQSFYEVYRYVIDKSNSSSKIRAIPRTLILPVMKLCYRLGLSPLGPYQYKMIASNFMFDTKKIKTILNWKPTKTNEEMLYSSYQYYSMHRKDIESRRSVSAHRKVSSMGVIRLLKWLS